MALLLCVALMFALGKSIFFIDADIALQKVKQKINIHKGALRSWHHYLLGFLYHHLNDPNFVCYNYQRILFKQSQMSRFLVIRSSETLASERVVPEKIIDRRFVYGVGMRDVLEMELRKQKVVKVTGSLWVFERYMKKLPWATS